MKKIKLMENKNNFDWLCKGYLDSDKHKFKRFLETSELDEIKDVIFNHIILLLTNPDVLEIEPRIVTQQSYIARPQPPVILGNP